MRSGNVIFILLLLMWLNAIALAQQPTRHSGRTIDQDWKAWPGGSADISLNPIEVFTSGDFGLQGNVGWSTTSCAIVKRIPEEGEECAEVWVRYDTVSPDAKRENAAKIVAIPGTGPTRRKFRTVFRASWEAPNTNGPIHEHNLLHFPASAGQPTTSAGFNWVGENGATMTSGKVECIVRFVPEGINWDLLGVDWTYSADGAEGKYRARLHRKRIATIVGQIYIQQQLQQHRQVGVDDADWEYDGDSSKGVDAQNPTRERPNRAFRHDPPSFLPSGGVQFGYRLDAREIVEWHDGIAWRTITGNENATWHFNGTSILPDGRRGGTNSIGSSIPSEDVPNSQPVAHAGVDQNVASGEVVTLYGSGTDSDNDTLSFKWTQKSGPQVILSDDTAPHPTFTAPAGDATIVFELKTSDICKNLHHHKPENFDSLGDEVTINVATP